MADVGEGDRGGGARSEPARVGGPVPGEAGRRGLEPAGDGGRRRIPGRVEVLHRPPRPRQSPKMATQCFPRPVETSVFTTHPKVLQGRRTSLPAPRFWASFPSRIPTTSVRARLPAGGLKVYHVEFV